MKLKINKYSKPIYYDTDKDDVICSEICKDCPFSIYNNIALGTYNCRHFIAHQAIKLLEDNIQRLIKLL